MTTRGFAVLVFTVMVAACSSSTSSNSSKSSVSTPASASTTTTPPTPLALHGTWVQPPTKISHVQDHGTTSTFQADSGTTWLGDVAGTTRFVMLDTIDEKNFTQKGTITETFTGSVAHVGSGHLHFRERFTVDRNGTLAIDATMVGGDGALAGMHGTMHFAGHIGDDGTGTGTYTASFYERAP